MRITLRVNESNPGHTRLSMWVNGGLSASDICLRTDELRPFIERIRADRIEGVDGSFGVPEDMKPILGMESK